jgi:hypothetical protein
VNGGRNPRNSGDELKTGTLFAVKSMVATALTGGPLSMPSAAEGGGRRPAFTEAYRSAKIGHRGRWQDASPDVELPVVVISDRVSRRF